MKFSLSLLSFPIEEEGKKWSSTSKKEQAANHSERGEGSFQRERSIIIVAKQSFFSSKGIARTRFYLL